MDSFSVKIPVYVFNFLLFLFLISVQLLPLVVSFSPILVYISQLNFAVLTTFLTAFLTQISTQFLIHFQLLT